MIASHHSIASASFAKKTPRALAKKNLFIVSTTFVPAPGGDFTNGETAYQMSDGTLIPFLAVLALA